MGHTWECVTSPIAARIPLSISETTGYCPIEDCQRPYCKYLRGELEHDDVHALNCSGIDPIETTQSALCSVAAPY